MTILFDLDGTLSDPFPGITACIRYALSELKMPVPEATALKWCIGPPLSQSFTKLLGTEDSTLVHEAIAKYRARYSEVGLYENAIYPGVEKMLQDLVKRGDALYVATSKPTVFAKRIVHHFQLEHYFVSIEGSELDGTRSSKGALIDYIIETHKLTKSKTTMVGDREHDMMGAREAGIRGLGVLWGYGTDAELFSAGAYACAKIPEDIPALSMQFSDLSPERRPTIVANPTTVARPS